MLHDLRYALRLIAKDRWFSAAAIVTLALGIGVNATGFTLVNGVLLRERSLRDSQQVFVLSWQGVGGRKVPLSHPEFLEWRSQSRSFAHLAGVINETVNISDDRGLPERAQRALVLGDAFAVFGQQPHTGRGFTAADERQGAPAVVIISHQIWRNRYAANPATIGSTLRVNGVPAMIVGVMPAGIRFPGNAEVWTPFIPTPDQARRSNRAVTVFARLIPGISRRQAETEATAVAQRAITTYPDDTRELFSMALESIPDRFVSSGPRTMFLAMMGAVSFVLLIACANLANLLLARSAARAREMALRMALGATRLRVARQLLVESVLLGCAGAVPGLLLAYAGVRLFDASVLDSSRPYWIVFTINYVVFAYVAAVGVVTAGLAGLAPALHLSRRNNSEALNEGARGSVGGPRMRWFSGAIVVAQLALTIVLLAGAGLMVRSFYNLRAVDNGYTPEHLLTMRLLLPGVKYPTARRATSLLRAVRVAARRAPGCRRRSHHDRGAPHQQRGMAARHRGTQRGPAAIRLSHQNWRPVLRRARSHTTPRTRFRARRRRARGIGRDYQRTARASALFRRRSHRPSRPLHPARRASIGPAGPLAHDRGDFPRHPPQHAGGRRDRPGRLRAVRV